MDNAVTLLPEPDSPTKASVSCSSILKLTLLTTRDCDCVSRLKAILKSSTDNKVELIDTLPCLDRKHL